MVLPAEHILKREIQIINFTLSEIVNRKNGLTVTVVCQNLRRGRFNSHLAVSFVRNNRAVKGKRAAVIRILR